MDSITWHKHAVMSAPEPPEPFDLKELRSLSPDELHLHQRRLAHWLPGRFVDSQLLRDHIAELNASWYYNEACMPGSKSILAVTGPNTIGKTTLVRRWAEGIHRQDVGAVDASNGQPRWNPSAQIQAALVPVIWVSLQARSKIAELNTQILQFLNYPTTGQIRAMTDRVVAAIPRHRVRLLVVDDVHLLKTSHRDGQDVLDHLKHLNTELGEHGGTLVLIGADLEYTDIVEDPQIAGRLKLITMTPFEVQDGKEDQARVWQSFLAETEDELLPYLPAGQSGMLSKTAAGLILRRTQGSMRDITALLNEATLQAATDDTWKITAKHLNRVKLSARAAIEEPLRNR
ncbi:TniB family NTP-binding protein [Kocuria sp. CPCC 205300]|uniref:TniB family NTP-binding protein n=1 Tax=Kocuria sabuli TaxID=3071448 RepID=UPI0036D7DC42